VPDFSFVVVAVIAFTAPVLRELIPKLFVPAIVLELLGGIIVGPQVFDIAHSSQSVELFSTIGLAALLFLAGREIDVNRLRGEVLERGLACFALGFMIAAAIAAPLHEVGLIKTPLLVAVILVATSLSVIIVPLRDAGEVNTPFGQQVIATAAIAEFSSVILISFFYSNERAGPGTEILHLSAFVLLAIVVFASVSRVGRNKRLSAALERLRESSAQIQTRADLALIAIVVGITSQLGLESILAAFTVGVIRGMTEERDEGSRVHARAAQTATRKSPGLIRRVRRRYSSQGPGQLFVFSPFALTYQLPQPPDVHTVRRLRSSISRRHSACTSGRTSR